MAERGQSSLQVELRAQQRVIHADHLHGPQEESNQNTNYPSSVDVSTYRDRLLAQLKEVPNHRHSLTAERSRIADCAALKLNKD